MIGWSANGSLRRLLLSTRLNICLKSYALILSDLREAREVRGRDEGISRDVMPEESIYINRVILYNVHIKRNRLIRNMLRYLWIKII